MTDTTLTTNPDGSTTMTITIEENRSDLKAMNIQNLRYKLDRTNDPAKAAQYAAMIAMAMGAKLPVIDWDELSPTERQAFEDWIGGDAGPCFVCTVHVAGGDDCPYKHYAAIGAPGSVDEFLEQSLKVVHDVDDV